MIKNRIWNKNTVNYRLANTWRITGNQFAAPMVSLRKTCMAKRVQISSRIKALLVKLRKKKHFCELNLTGKRLKKNS